MTIYVFGLTVNGELGLGGIEEDIVLTPRELEWPGEDNVLDISCGDTHTLFLSKNGKVYSSGSNDFGQLGHDEKFYRRPNLIRYLENIKQVRSGYEHSLALDEWGQVYSWGNNNFGQLGHSNKRQSKPKIMRDLASTNIVQISCGFYHCLALSNNGELYSWGRNSHGQLGLGSKADFISKPSIVKSLIGIPIAFITCGGNHSFVISKSGTVFGWGRNDHGEVGSNDQETKLFPVQLKTLRNLNVRYISCGEDFSVFLTADGGVFTCGAGSYGQLGHGGLNNEILPRKIVELMGSNISQIATGRRHALCLDRKKLYGFGLGCSGQLGNRSNNSNVPIIVLGPWITANVKVLNENYNELNVKKIVSGGDRSIVLLEDCVSDDYREYNDNSQILNLTKKICKTILDVPLNTKVNLDLITVVEIIFKSQACLNGSFLLPSHHGSSTKNNGINLPEAVEIFELIRKIENQSIKQIIWDGITNEILQSLVAAPPDIESLRIYIILPIFHEFVNAKNHKELHTPFSQAVQRLTEIPKKILSLWWSSIDTEYFERLVQSFKSVILYIIQFSWSVQNGTDKKRIRYDANLSHALNFLIILYRINNSDRIDKITYDFFYLPELNDLIDVQQDYIDWILDNNPNRFYLCNYPFIFDATAKTLLLQTDQALQMHSAMNAATTRGIFSLFTSQPIPISQYVVLNISRETLVEDTLREIQQYGPNDLKKPLKIKFFNEEAEDAGGVRKEFFMLLLKDILDPKYGMFEDYEETRTMWFSHSTFEAEDMYLLIGVICGLAIYNFTIINLPFPLALYKKLLDESICLDDLNDLSPSMAKSLKNILDYDDDDMEEVFSLNFEITRECFGEIITTPLKLNGEEIAVNKQNKKEFVDLYVDFIFNKSVENQFKAFRDGFMKVCGGRVLSIFKAHELMNVVVGNEDYDWNALEAECEYKNGYTYMDKTIKWFWEIFHELPFIEKKKFLLYLTGSDRIPIQGMKAIKVIIQPTKDERFLPVAHTCFNLLDLPRYSTKERLKYKLLQAIQQTQGFSLV